MADAVSTVAVWLIDGATILSAGVPGSVVWTGDDEPPTAK